MMTDTPLDLAIKEHLATGKLAPVVRPFADAILFVAGAEFPLYDRPVFYARPDKVTGEAFLTASERKRRIADNPGVVPIQTTGRKLLRDIDPAQALYLMLPAEQGGVMFDAEQVDWLRTMTERAR